MKLKFAALIGGFALGALMILAGVLIERVANPTDHCRDALSAATSIIVLNNEVIEISTKALRASGNDDVAALQRAADQLQDAERRLGEIQPRYVESTRKCEGK